MTCIQLNSCDPSNRCAPCERVNRANARRAQPDPATALTVIHAAREPFEAGDEVAAHVCRSRYEPAPEVQRVTCGGCGAQWCERCDPAPSALCHVCNGRGYSTAPLDSIGRRRAAAIAAGPQRNPALD